MDKLSTEELFASLSKCDFKDTQVDFFCDIGPICPYHKAVVGSIFTFHPHTETQLKYKMAHHKSSFRKLKSLEF